MLSLQKVHVYMLILCAFMVFQCSYFYLKPALLHDYNKPEDNLAYGTYIWYEFPEFATHDYIARNLIDGSVLIACIYVFMRVGNIAYILAFKYRLMEIEQ